MPGGSIDEPSIPLHPARHLLLPLGCINVHGGVLVGLTLYQQLGQLGHHLLLQPSPDWSCTIYPEPQKYESVFNPINEHLRHGNLSHGMPPRLSEQSSTESHAHEASLLPASASINPTVLHLRCERGELAECFMAVPTHMLVAAGVTSINVLLWTELLCCSMMPFFLVSSSWSGSFRNGSAKFQGMKDLTGIEGRGEAERGGAEDAKRRAPWSTWKERNWMAAIVFPSSQRRWLNLGLAHSFVGQVKAQAYIKEEPHCPYRIASLRGSPPLNRPSTRPRSPNPFLRRLQRGV